jgi:hypothetical protein
MSLAGYVTTVWGVPAEPSLHLDLPLLPFLLQIGSAGGRHFAARAGPAAAASHEHSAARSGVSGGHDNVRGAPFLSAWRALRGDDQNRTQPSCPPSQADAIIGYPVHKIFETMVSTELIGRVYDPEAKYLKHRRVLVDWLCEVGEDNKLAMSTVHVAVAYLDSFLQKMDVHRSRLQVRRARGTCNGLSDTLLVSLLLGACWAPCCFFSSSSSELAPTLPLTPALARRSSRRWLAWMLRGSTRRRRSARRPLMLSTASPTTRTRRE